MADASLEQHSHRLRVPLATAPACAMDRCEAIGMAIARIEPMLNQHLGHLRPPLETRAMHRRVAVLLADGHISTRRKQCLERLHFALVVGAERGVRRDGARIERDAASGDT